MALPAGVPAEAARRRARHAGRRGGRRRRSCPASSARPLLDVARDAFVQGHADGRPRSAPSWRSASAVLAVVVLRDVGQGRAATAAGAEADAARPNGRAHEHAHAPSQVQPTACLGIRSLMTQRNVTSDTKGGTRAAVAYRTTTISIPRLRDAVHGRVIAPGRRRVRRGADRVLRRDRPHGRRLIVRVADADDVATRRHARARDRAGAGRPQRRPQRRRPQRRPTAGSCSTCADMKALDIDVDGADRVGRDRPDRGRVLDRGRRRTAWRPASATPARSASAGITLGGGVGYLVRQVRPDDRLPAGRRGRHRRRRAPPRRRRDAPRPLLGDPRRRRQLRRRDPLPVPAARGPARSSAGC